MLVRIQPSTARGRITAPPSKSMAHRMLICAALAEGTSTIHGIDLSQDILATIDGLRALGADITCQDGNAIVWGTDVTCRDGIANVRGMNITCRDEKVTLGVANGCASAEDADVPGEDAGNRGVSEPATSILPCRESGSTLRFLIPLCLMDGTNHVLTGSERLFERPLKVYEKICKEQGLVFLKEKNSVQVAGTLAAGQYEIPGNVSSQFISGLLFVLPLLSDDSRIRLTGPVESRPYIDMTMQVMRSFGVHTAWKDERTIDIPGRQQYCSQDVQIEGDYSNAAFFDAFNLIGGDVTVEGLAQGSVQGDRIYKQYFDQMEEGFTEIDLTDCPDLGPILMVLAAMRHGAQFTGTARLRFKESSRGAAMKEELEKAGAQIELADNEIRVAAGVGTPSETLHGQGDHRIVMALAVLLSKVGGSISGAEAVAKSLPDFWERLKSLGIQVRLENEAEVRREVETDREAQNVPGKGIDEMRALIAMSGGVDSSVAAQMMASRGYECVGCTMRLYENDVVGMDLMDTCCSLENTQDARNVTEKIGIPYHIVHYENLFRQEVIEPFIDEYLHGRTPNPCIECNRKLKFQHLYEKMKELGCDLLVTGHYARVRFDEESGRYQLLKALDLAKDQSYVLYVLTQEQLAHVQFPLGEQDKHKTREIASESGFQNAGKHDSQDICFVPDGDYAGFIERYSGKTCPAGDFVDADGNVLGRHKGIIHYTLGQRRGLGLPAANRLYVTGIDPESNTVTIGSNDDLMKTTLYARKVNLIAMDRIETPLRCSAKIRYRHKEQPCTVTQPEDDLLKVVFDEPQRAITPGQSVVLYDGDVVLGGGVIVGDMIAE